MLARVSPAVVSVAVQKPQQNPAGSLLHDPLFRQFFDPPDDKPRGRFRAMGSGVIYDARLGYVVTNNHVVEHADAIQITLADHRRLDARLIGADSQTDIAVLKVDPDGLTALPFADPGALKIGDYVVALGDAFDVGPTATFGIVSALGRTGLGIERYEDFIQTDASINPGDSGGALVDLRGRLVGINTATMSRGGGNVGIGFAIPVDMVRAVALELVATGAVSRGEPGLETQEVTPALARVLGVKQPGGALVSRVQPASAAAKAGVLEGDVVTSLDGVAVSSAARMRTELGRRQPGATVRLTVWRDGAARTLPVVLEAAAAAPVPAAPGKPESVFILGMTASPIPRTHPRFGETSGVYIGRVDPGGAAEEAGIRVGDILVSVDRKPVATVEELTRRVRDRRKGAGLLLRLWRGATPLYAAIG